MYTAPVRGKVKRKVVSPIQNFSGLDGVVRLAGEMGAVKQQTLLAVNAKLAEIDDIVSEKIQEVDSTIIAFKEEFEEIKLIQKGEPGVDADEQKIYEAVMSSIRIPQDGENPDPEDVIAEVLKRMPASYDENLIIDKLSKRIPDQKTIIKEVQSKITVDPMSVVEKIMALPESKFKLKVSQIDGLDQTISAYRNQLSRGYLHGGGDTVVAGTGVTITTLSNGQKQINASAGTGTVSTVSVVTANGVSGTVTNPTTTPAITLVLGAITPTSVNGTTSVEIGYVSGVTSSIQTQLNAKQGTITLTTTGSSGVATLIGNTLNIPNYSSGSGGITRSISSVAVNTAMGSTAAIDYVYFVSGTTTMTLPTAVGNTNRYTLVHTDTNVMTIATTSAQTIAFYPAAPATTATVSAQGLVTEIYSDGANWWTI